MPESCATFSCVFLFFTALCAFVYCWWEGGSVYVILKVHVSPVSRLVFSLVFRQLKIFQLIDVLVIRLAFPFNLTLTNSTADNFHLL